MVMKGWEAEAEISFPSSVNNGKYHILVLFIHGFAFLRFQLFVVDRGLKT